jgi:CRP-like cAMP-binding protein
MQPLEQIIAAHPFFAGLRPQYTHLIGGCAHNVRFEPGQFLLQHGAPADEFYLLRHGRVALALGAPGRSPVTIQTLGPGELLGVSWLVAPYRWMYDAEALEPVGAVAIDAACLRAKSEADHDLGFELAQRFMGELVRRLHAARLQLLDVYGTRS